MSNPVFTSPFQASTGNSNPSTDPQNSSGPPPSTGLSPPVTSSPPSSDTSNFNAPPTTSKSRYPTNPSVQVRQGATTATPTTAVPTTATSVSAPFVPVNRSVASNAINYNNNNAATAAPHQVAPENQALPEPATLDPNRAVVPSLSISTNPFVLPQSHAAQPLLVDAGVAIPSFVRLTTTLLPNSTKLQKSFSTPFAALITPLAWQEAEEVPLVDMGPNGPVRCSRCGAFVNPLVVFTNGGRNYICRFCGNDNEVRSDYFCPMDPQGGRQDVFQRPELCKGTVDFVASHPIYNEGKNIQPMAWLFTIDVTIGALQSGLLAKACQVIQSILTLIPQDSKTKIGIMTFDSQIHYYNLSPGLQQAQIMVCPDVDDTFLPMSPDALLVPYHSSKKIIDSLIQNLPIIYSQTKTADSAFGGALNASILLVESMGGKVFTFCGTLPNVGPGKMHKRDDSKAIGTDKEKLIFTPQDHFYKRSGINCAKKGVGVELFLAPSSGYIDVATLAPVAALSGGGIWYYPAFNIHKDGDKLLGDVWQCFSRETGTSGLFKVRTSRGIAVQKHFGHFFTENDQELEFGSIDADKVITVSMAFEDDLDEKDGACIQAALLYTTSEGQRRVRVMTVGLSVTNTLASVFKFCDSMALFNYFARTLAVEAWSVPLKTLREKLLQRLAAIFGAYKTHCATNQDKQKLTIPDPVKYLPVYLLALSKHPAFRLSHDVSPDYRITALHNIISMPVSRLHSYVYPRLFELTNQQPELFETEYFPLLKKLASNESMKPHAVLLCENAENLIIWIGREVDQDTLVALFGVGSVLHLQSAEIGLMPPEHSAMAKWLHTLINKIRQQTLTGLNIRIIKQGDVSESKLAQLMIQDAQGFKEYYQYLTELHKYILRI